MAFVAGVASATAVIATLVTFVRWCYGPRLICGIPPNKDERTQRCRELSDKGVGSPSVASSFTHREDYLAQRLTRWNRRSLSYDREGLLRSQRCRLIAAGADGETTFPILLINNGRNAARDYVATLGLYERHGRAITLLRVLTETLESYTYVTNPHSLKLAGDKNSVVHSDIVAAYHAYQHPVGLWTGGAIWAKGNLNAQSVEMVLVTAQLADDIEEFFVVYTLTYLGKRLTPPTYIQACRVQKPLTTASSQSPRR